MDDEVMSTDEQGRTRMGSATHASVEAAPALSTIIASPLRGSREELADVDDPAFSQKILGDGVAVRPAEGLVLSPVDGRIAMTFPTRHAIGITSDDGVEVLIHIGLDTVTMQGDGFDLLVDAGQCVVVGDPLVSFDIPKIIAAGYDPVTVMVITNTQSFAEIRQIGQTDLEPGDPVLEVLAKEHVRDDAYE